MPFQFIPSRYFHSETSEIDEFVFDDETAMDKFSEKVYYTGVLNYYTKDNEIYHSLSNEESTYTQTEFNKLSNWINDKYAQLKENASKLYRSDNNPLPNPSKDGWNGFYTWSDVSSFNNSNGYSNSEWKYLDGINWNGITASGLQFIYTFSENLSIAVSSSNTNSSISDVARFNIT